MRPVLFLAVSCAVHLAAVVALAGLAMEAWIPHVEITWLDLDNRLGAPAKKPAAKRPARVEPRPKQRPKVKPRPRPKPKKLAAARTAPDAGPPAPDAAVPNDAGTAAGPALADLAPGDAALILVLRMDRVRGSPYEQAVRRLLEVFYDYKTLLWSNSVDPIRDFDALLIATPNPYRVTRTFLAARHRLPRHRIRAALEQSVRFKSKRMRWRRLGAGKEQGQIPSPPRLPQDPRVVLLQNGLVMLTDPSHVPLLSTELSTTAPRPGSGSNVDAGARTGGSWLDALRQMSTAGGSDPEGPAMQLLAVNLPRLVRLPPDIPLPLAMDVRIRAVAPTVARGELTFAGETDARRFLKVIPRRIERAKRSILLRLLGVTDLLDGIKLRRQGERVLATLKLSAEEVRSVLELFRGMIPQVRVPGMPPRRPPDAGQPPDSGRPPDSTARPGSPDAGPTPQTTRSQDARR